MMRRSISSITSKRLASAFLLQQGGGVGVAAELGGE